MKVIIKGKGSAIALNQSHFKATGGQASIYIRDGKAFKIYTDPKDTIPDAKFLELSAIQDTFVIKPQAILLDEKNNRIGYVMDTVASSVSLCQLFTRNFRKRNHINNKMIVDLIADGQSHITNIHRAGCLVVDLNENNEIVSPTFDHCYFLDVDSYQTKNFPATVINPSIRDYSVSAKEFSELSDWFSWAVLSFQLFIGCHPYKGSYPALDNLDKDKRLEERMRRHISAFRKDISLPNCCESFDIIPQHYKDWLFAVLDQGKRLAPPDPTTVPVQIIQSAQRIVKFLTGQLEIKELYSFEDGFSYLVESNNIPLVLFSYPHFKENRLERKIEYNSRKIFSDANLPGIICMGFSPKMNNPIGLYLWQGQLTLIHFTKGTKQVLHIKALEIREYNNRFYIRTASNILELIIRESSTSTLITYHPVASVLEHATTLYDGVAIQNITGSVYISLFPETKKGIQIRIPELDNVRILNAKFSGGVLMTIISKNGKDHRQVFRFAEDRTYDYRIIENIDSSELNFITLSNGVCLVITDEEKLEAFSTKKGSVGVKVIDDPAIGHDIRLLVVRDKAAFEKNGKIFSISLSKP